MTKMMRTKFNFRKQQLDAKNRLDAQIKAAEEKRKAEAAKKAEAAAAASRAESARQYNPNIHGATNYGLGSDGNQSFDSGQGFGTNATSGGPVSNRTGRGRTDYNKGGLATMFKLKG
jgi:membrane protein involved in colicin uptake